ncbi:MAG: hypothetical protein HDS78_07165 [Bacteroidales bacterium]|nr:hypothetical protein [Bacteroidales bacterium]
MTKTIYLLEWYGPFSTPKDVLEWENKQIGNGKTYLYLFKGKKKSQRTFSYYCGQAFAQTAGKRMTNKAHHIHEVIERQSELSIWVAKFQNKKPNKQDVNLVEKLITSAMSQVIIADENAILNQTNKLGPKTTIYLINEWFKRNGDPWEKYRKDSIPCLIHDILICYPHENSTSLYGNRRTQYIKDIEINNNK